LRVTPQSALRLTAPLLGGEPGQSLSTRFLIFFKRFIQREVISTQSLFKQTRTRVHSLSAQKREREQGLLCASRTATAIQLGAQLLLWIFFFGYDQIEHTVWQAVLMLLVPLLLLWLVWKKADLCHPSARWWLLPLTLCLTMDAAFLILCLGGFISQSVPTYPAWVIVFFPVLLCFLTALCARARGVKYGASILAVPLAALLIFGTVFLRASTRADRMWPILGDGLLSTAQSALSGAGAVWIIPLLFLKNRQKTAGWAIVPWALAVVCALWFGFLNPWSAGDDLAIAEKMMGLARHAHSVILYEMTGILWMILLPAALIACFCTFGDLIRRAFPRFPFGASLLPAAVLGCGAALLWPDRLFALLHTLLPWRYAVSLFCGAGLLFTGRRRA